MDWFVTPAKAGAQSAQKFRRGAASFVWNWIPAFAGMTEAA